MVRSVQHSPVGRGKVPGETGVMPGLAAILVQDSLRSVLTQIAQGTTYMGILIKAPTRRREGGLSPVSTTEAPADPSGALHIREVVRITGLRREQLYMWQRRYG